jgi:copper chaperone CopZ
MENQKMTKIVFTIPALFGDHHTSAVKEILTGVEGITSFYVSSGFHQVEVDYDPDSTTEETIKNALAGAGYLEGGMEELYPNIPTESATRHTEAFSEIIRFTDTAPSWQGRPLWPCPGIEYQTQMEE